MFLDYLNLEGALEKQAIHFLSKARNNLQWVEESFIRFIGFQIERTKRGEIAEQLFQITIKQPSYSVK
jgi:hypothetical protein